jgi:hypothetical protein
MGREVLEMGGNAVVGFKQNFDLEKEECIITARAIGTCLSISPLQSLVSDIDDIEDHDPTSAHAYINCSLSLMSIPSVVHSFDGQMDEDQKVANEDLPSSLSFEMTVLNSPTTATGEPVRRPVRRVSINAKSQTLPPSTEPSSTEDLLVAGSSPTSPELPNADAFSGHFSLASSNVPFQTRPASAGHRTALLADEDGYRAPTDPVLVTLHRLPRDVISGVGGIVSARSVKLFQNDDSEVREAWWTELRDEIRSHAKALSCSVVAGYTESTAIQDDLCVLSAMGTAVNLDFKSLYMKGLEPLMAAVAGGPFQARPSMNPSIIGTGMNSVPLGMTK